VFFFFVCSLLFFRFLSLFIEAGGSRFCFCPSLELRCDSLRAFSCSALGAEHEQPSVRGASDGFLRTSRRSGFPCDLVLPLAACQCRFFHPTSCPMSGFQHPAQHLSPWFCWLRTLDPSDSAGKNEAFPRFTSPLTPLPGWGFLVRREETFFPRTFGDPSFWAGIPVAVH